MTAPSLRDHIARVIESVAHDPGGRPCEPCVETADAVLGDWLRRVDEHLQAHAPAWGQLPAEPTLFGSSETTEMTEHSEDFEPCGSFDCSLPKGHNMGRADIPANHHSEAIAVVRERIADRLFGQIHGQGITSPLLLADAVLDALGLEQVGWLAEHERLREVVRRIVDDETVVINEEGYLVVLMTDDPDRSSTIVDLTPEQFAAVKRAISGSSEEDDRG